LAFGLPRATYQKTSADEARPALQYRPNTGLRSAQSLLRVRNGHARRDDRCAVGLRSPGVAARRLPLGPDAGCLTLLMLAPPVRPTTSGLPVAQPVGMGPSRGAAV